MARADAQLRAAARALADGQGIAYSVAVQRLRAAAKPPVARDGWSTWATVRITRDCVAYAPEYGTVPRHFRAGEELEMVQHGAAGRPVSRDTWWTSYDIDRAYILDAGHVEVVRVTREVPPVLRPAR